MKYLSCADTAKLIRQALKEAFPGIKFSVRSSTYSGGASIGVSWTDGPNVDQVEAVAKVFRGSYFDSSIDYQGATYAMIDGEQVRFGADYVNCRRAYSRALCEKLLSRLHIDGLTIAGSDDDAWFDAADHDVVRWARVRLYKHSDRLKVEKSKTAGKVIYLGNDGYSAVRALNV
ncbi:LPD29 domain-containing protein [Paraburkholderia kururiensis]|uniref:LPD29 domain-containing protein n=1 Tax=Paraburkholderia kururiensis TaxID=984307 RepID=A0ABZ0WV53_9BURK|nr:LPD29 domain-containing protein [Paraburkholderia kururiensis]WQD81279.1 LPD29 domain-containing protein [Paraburkholderia kururiensis]